MPACSLGLDLISLAEKSYLLVLRRADLKLPHVLRWLRRWAVPPFRREVGSLVGYDMRTAGDRLLIR